jgi:hypothetical protein
VAAVLQLLLCVSVHVSMHNRGSFHVCALLEDLMVAPAWCLRYRYHMLTRICP